MVPNARKAFNDSFTAKRYAAFLKEMSDRYPGALEFRLAETPVFIPKDFKEKVLSACESIVDVIVQPGFKAMTQRAIPADVLVPGENDHTHFIAFDFGVCENEAGELEPQLIEMQGFPTLFTWQLLQAEAYRNHFPIPEGFSNFLNGYDRESYLQLLKTILLGNHAAENVVLLEIYPHQQKTRVDFYSTQEFTGIQPVCLTELIAEGNKLHYLREGVKTPIHRIYNRLIFDDLHQQKDLGPVVDLTQAFDVEWVPHPNWFYRISKFTLPFIDHPYIPKTFFLNELETIPIDLENYVLKPLFSFAGQGVVIDVTPEDITAIKDPENWILQRKVKYAAVIETPNEPAKAEIRIFYFWKDGDARPIAVHNLARLSKGKMIGVRYNADKDWVGGSECFFE
jgi:hypothetical protein